MERGILSACCFFLVLPCLNLLASPSVVWCSGFYVKGQKYNPYRVGQVFCSLYMLGDLFFKGLYFGVSGFKVENVTQRFERVFQDNICLFKFLDLCACFENE